MADPIVFEYRYETRASIARAFKAMSDTDAFNGVAKGGMNFSQELQADGRTSTIGKIEKLGMTILWEEKPFSFRAPYWFRTRREFTKGPMARMTARVQFAALPTGGTVIAYQMEVLAANALVRPIVAFDIKRNLQRNIKTAIEAVLAYLEQDADEDPERSYAGSPPALKPHEAARLTALVEELPETHLRQRLLSFIRAAPEREQHSMSAIALAQAWIAPLEDVASLFVSAAKIGLLGVRIDLLCPACLVPKAAVDEHGRLPQVHCESCGIPLDSSYPEGLAVHFFPSPQIRNLKVRMECFGRPGRTPQIVAQDAVPPGKEVDLATYLEPGTYQLRTLPALGPPALLEVREGESNKTASFTLHGSIQPQFARVRPEPESLIVRNTSDAPVFAVLEHVIPPRRVLSLGRMLVEYPELREIVPATGFITTLSSFSGTAVSVRAPTPEVASQLESKLARARLTYVSGQVLLCLYADGATAHEDLRALDIGALLLMIGVSDGVVCESSIGNRRVPVGPAVDEAYAAMCAAEVGAIGRAR